ncbi:MAG TPA: hypothetical protein VKQ70_13065 [Caulobacteraceae bacterium]|nr:hypothetical protein [Caulobacteraceae bacterium]
MTFQENRNIPTSHVGHGQGPAGASLSDLLTAVQHVASNIAEAAQTYLAVNGQQSRSGIAAAGPQLLKQGSGRVAYVNVTVAGTTVGALVDSNSAAATSPVLAVIPDTVGSYFVNLPFNLGLVVVPGTGMTLSVSFS